MVYVVKQGDTLFSLARRYSTSAESIMQLNNLQSNSLYLGQRLQIPLYEEAIVTVDSAGIRREPSTSAGIIAYMVRGARLPVTGSAPGWYRVRIHNGSQGWVARQAVQKRVYGGQKPIQEIVGFYTVQEGPSLPSSFQSFVSHTGLISDLPLFFYRISANNPTQIEKFSQFSDSDVHNLVAIAHRNNVKIMPVVHNLLYREGGTTLAKNVVRVMTGDSGSRAAFIGNILKLIEQFDFDGVNIDIEDVYKEDSAALSKFYTELGAAMARRGYFLSASVPARIRDEPFNPFSDPFDYTAIGRAVNQFIVMLYNEHGWPGSGPGPVVSIGWMEKVLRYTVTKVPRQKVVAAVSVFGFDFNLTTKRNTYVTYQMAMDLAKRFNKTVIFDQATQTPMFSYTDTDGSKHEVWFENAQSIRAKIDFAWSMGIRGVALWRLGMEDPAIWTMISNDVVVKRY